MTMACDGGIMRACSVVGTMYATAEGTRKSMDMALEYYKKACEGDDPFGCNFLGIMYEKAFGVLKNDKKAYEYYQKACDNNFTDSCESAQRLKKD